MISPVTRGQNAVGMLSQMTRVMDALNEMIITVKGVNFAVRIISTVTRVLYAF